MLNLNFKDGVIAVLLFLVIILISFSTCSNRRNLNLANNIKALTDSVNVLETRNHDLVYAKQSLILEKGELEDYLDISKKKVKELERTLQSKTKQIAELQSQIRVDSIVTNNTVVEYVKDSLLHVNFDYCDQWFSLDGSTRWTPLGTLTNINLLTMNVPLTIGWTEKKQVFVLTDNPYVSFPVINAAEIENTKSNRPKRFNIGLQLSLISVQYDLISRRIGVGPSLGGGLSVGYSF